jgi:hypothetical protein
MTLPRIKTRRQYRRWCHLVDGLDRERQIPLLGPWLVLTINPWWYTLDLAGWWLLAKARHPRSLRQGWFAGRLRKEESQS